MGFPWKVDAPESFSPLIMLAHGRKTGNEIRASQSCSVVCSFGELNPFKPNILASQMQGARSRLWTSRAEWEDGKVQSNQLNQSSYCDMGLKGAAQFLDV